MSAATDRDLTASLARDDAAEDRGMHADDRETCWQCQSWADHAHDWLTDDRLTLDQYAERRQELERIPPGDHLEREG